METRTDPLVSAPWLRTVPEVAASFGGDAERGLTEHDAARRLTEHGPNTLETTARRGPAQVLARQFTNTMILILAAVGVVTFVVGDHVDTVVIAVIVMLNAIIGFVQEYRAERAMDELGQLTAATARVVRDGTVVEVPAASLVPGDLVRLAAGDVVPADLRLVETAGLQIAEAALTGEAESVAKHTAPIAEDTGFVGDRRNMAFKGTAAADGRGHGIVVATGMATELGRIATLLSEDRGQTPLQRRLAVLGRRLAAIAALLCAVVFVSGVLRGEGVGDMLVAAISLAVAAIPEGLPAVVTVALGLGARRMARRRALVRRLPAVETLGAVGVICTDKTGTLTQNQMAVERVWTPDGEYDVNGRGYEPTATITGRTGAPGEDLSGLALVAAACNDAVLHEPSDGPDWTVTGDPTEGALLALARRADVGDPPPRVAELPFEADRKRMTTAHAVDGSYWVATKGALEALVPLLHPDESEDAATVAADQLAAEGYRVLGLADRQTDELPADPADMERDLRLLGVVGIADPPRPEARDSVDACRDAGVTTVMITGDHPRTARAIARRLDIIDDGDDDEDVVLTGAEVADLDDDELTERVAAVRVFARTAPAQKLRIVDAWRRRDVVVAMTGDGVNDAPALQRADIGVAMGINGTDVSREAADMVLADDNFATIVDAIGEGRRIYDNLRRFVLYLLSTNSAEVLVVLIGPFLGLPLPLTATQILYINLVTDGVPAVALGLEPAEPDVMKRPPRPSTASILGQGLWKRCLVVGSLMATAVLALQVGADHQGLPWQTMGFMTLAILQLGHAIAVRSGTHPLRALLRINPLLGLAVLASLAAQLAVVYVPVFQDAFATEPLTPGELGIVGAICGVGFAVGELDRARRARSPRPAD
ncbi:MAG: cation-translocating P-type ATPase [Acidimicrobiales bacterium]|nr:cation-translocating P-type ATPase [Acidimicrobiales bacterium]